MHRGRLFRSTIALLALLTGCTMRAEEPSETLEQGVERARSYVEDTLKAINDGYDIMPDPGADPGECTNDLGMGSGTFVAEYGVKIRLSDRASATRLFEKTSAYWDQKGYTTSFENAQRGEPVGDDAVVAVEMEDGYYGALELFPSRGNAYLGIATPCLPKASEE